MMIIIIVMMLTSSTIRPTNNDTRMIRLLLLCVMCMLERFTSSMFVLTAKILACFLRYKKTLYRWMLTSQTIAIYIYDKEAENFTVYIINFYPKHSIVIIALKAISCNKIECSLTRD